MFKKILLLTHVISIAYISKAQQDSIVMDGTLSVHKSNTFKYKIVVANQSGKWNGYSVLDEGGPNETRSGVTVQFVKEKEALVLAEKNVLSTKSKEKSFCFVGALLKMNEKKNVAKGFFLGQDEKKQMCGNGSIKLSIPERAKKLMTPDGTRDTNISAIVTSQKSEKFDAKHPQIQLEIWDGGINDQDSLTVVLNGQTVISPFQISNEKQIVTINLKKGENLLKIKALNEGVQPPNSAKIILADLDNRLPIVSFLKKDEEATIKIRY